MEERAQQLGRSLEAAQAEREKENRKHEAAVNSLKNDLAELRQVSQPLSSSFTTSVVDP